MTLRHRPFNQRRVKDSLLAPTRWISPPRMTHTLIAAVLLTVSGSADAGFLDRGFKVVSITYGYTDQNRMAREREALHAAQDECFLAGYEYAQPAGPPEIVSYGGLTSEPIRATKSFYCIGMRGQG